MSEVNVNAQYRQCFSSDAGKFVLGDLLKHCGYFDTDLKTTEEIAVQNFVKKILMNMGIVNKEDKIPEFVNKIFELRSE